MDGEARERSERPSWARTEARGGRRSDADQRVHLDQVTRAWAGRHDVALTFRPTQHGGGSAGGCADCPAEIDCASHPERMRITYAPTVRDREIVQRRDRTCIHPGCRRPARRCDCDHIVAFDPDDPEADGVTCPRCNLAPLCRHHHRLKTLAGWRYWKVGPPGSYAWRDPHGVLYLRTRDGTRALE
jgi:hypothetical protein